MQYNINRARSAQMKHGWALHTYASVAELYNNVFELHNENDKKDGNAFTAACLIGTNRKAAAVKEISLFVYDIDGDQTYAEIRDLLVKSGFEAILYTTYSHKTTKTYVRTDKYVAWAKRNGQPERHTPDSVKAFLIANKKESLIPKITKVYASTFQTTDGISILIEHEPLDKVRVVLPMSKPFVIGEVAYTMAEAVQLWKRKYVGLGEKIGLKFDPACMDTARLHYTPSHPPGGLDVHTEWLRGNLVDPDTVSAASIDSVLTRREVENEGESVVVEGFDVSQWIQNRGRGVGDKLVELLVDADTRLGGIIRGDRGDKPGLHITCPYEDEHTSVDENSKGTFIDPGTTDRDSGEDVDGFPKIHCCHAHCVDRKTEHFIGGMLKQQWFSSDDLVRISTRASQENALRAAGIDPSTFASGEAKIEPEAVGANELSHLADDFVKEDDEGVNLVTRLKAMIKSDSVIHKDIDDKLKTATTGVEVRELIVESANKGATNTNAHAIYCLALSGMSLRGVKMYYGPFAGESGINVNEFIDLVKQVRAEKRNINAAVGDLTLANMQNTALHTEFRRLGEYYGMSASAVHDMYVAATNNVASAAQVELNNAAEELSKRYAKLVRPNDMYLLDMEETKRTGRMVVYTKTALDKMLSNRVVRMPGRNNAQRFEYVFDFWFTKWPIHTIFTKTIFDPRVTDPPPDTFNAFLGFRTKPRAGDASPILNHIRDIWCKGDLTLFNWVMTYLANIFQDPGRKYPSAIVLIGPPGSGKSLPLEYGILPMTAPYSTMSGKREDLQGRFNANMEHCIVYVSEESFFSGDAATAAKLKNLISAQEVQIEKKGVDTEVTNNLIRYFFVANEIHTMKIDHDDRRYLVLDVSGSKCQNVEYFSGLRRWLDTGGREIWMDFLLNWDPAKVGLTWDCLYKPPVTATKLAQVKFSLNATQMYLREMALNGTVLSLMDDNLNNIRWRLDAPLIVRDRDWQLLWDSYLRANGHKSYIKSQLSDVVVKTFGDKVKLKFAARATDDGPMLPCTVLPSRREALNILLAQQFISPDEYASALQFDEGDAK